MAKKPRAKTKVAKTRAAAAPAPPSPKTLMDFTEQGFDALKQRRKDSTDGKLDKKGKVFADAVEQLKAGYERLLKRDE